MRQHRQFNIFLCISYTYLLRISQNVNIFELQKSINALYCKEEFVKENVHFCSSNIFTFCEQLITRAQRFGRARWGSITRSQRSNSEMRLITTALLGAPLAFGDFLRSPRRPYYSARSESERSPPLQGVHPQARLERGVLAGLPHRAAAEGREEVPLERGALAGAAGLVGAAVLPAAGVPARAELGGAAPGVGEARVPPAGQGGPQHRPWSRGRAPRPYDLQLVHHYVHALVAVV